MIFKIPRAAIPRLQGMIADGSDSDGTPELVLRFDVQTKDGKPPSKEELREIRALLAAWGVDGPYDDKTKTGFSLPKTLDDE
jgi:hypothetical protein